MRLFSNQKSMNMNLKTPDAGNSVPRVLLIPLFMAACVHPVPPTSGVVNGPSVVQHELDENTVTCDEYIQSMEVPDPIQDGDDLHGGSAFQAVVCGYAQVNTAILTSDDIDGPPIGEDPIRIDYVELVVTSFKDRLFEELVRKNAEDGNMLTTTDGHIALGCVDGGLWINIDGNDALLSATKKEPVIVTLSFDEHSGHGSDCPSLVDGVEISGME